MAKVKLTAEQQIFIIQRVAQFETPETVAKAFAAEYGIEIRRQQAESYDPTKLSGAHLSERMKELFHTTRENFLKNVTAIPIANKAYRVQALDRMARTAELRGNMVLAQSLMEQAAKEMGEAYTNRQKVDHTSSDGSMTPKAAPPPVIDQALINKLVDKLVN